MEIKADLHIHSVLSPCGDLDMSPVNIVDAALKKDLSIIGISDHNSTRQAPIIKEYAATKGLFVIMGVEVNTIEEAHCLAYFPTLEIINQFQSFLDQHLPFIPNNPDKFGYQVVVNYEDEILYQEEKLLISALDASIDKVEKEVHQLGGIFIPAHVDKSRFSIISQLGFIPKDLICDSVEISSNTTIENALLKYPYLKKYNLIQNSDAHYIQDIGKAYTKLNLTEITFESIKKALQVNDFT